MNTQKNYTNKESIIKCVLQMLAKHFGFELVQLGKKNLIWALADLTSRNLVFDEILNEYLAYQNLSTLLYKVINCEKFKWKKTSYNDNTSEDFSSLKNDFFKKGYDLNKLMITLGLLGIRFD